MTDAIERLLGRPATEAERAIAADQAARIEAGVMQSPLLDSPVHGGLRLAAECGALCRTVPFGMPGTASPGEAP